MQALAEGVIESDRIMLSKAITLVESARPEDQAIAQQLIDSILPHTGKSIRIGITGAPGVGKSTFIETFGKHLLSLNKKIAVLTVDPTSQLTHGSILGDKTRMEELSKNKMAYIRPSSSGEKLGGVTHKTREAILLCEAAGFEIIIIETVGVGQSEVSVKNMVDFFLLLMLARGGDELQGIKKGIIEMADAIAITKADGDNITHAARAQAEYQQALHFQSSAASAFHAKVLTCSAFTGAGIDTIWNTIAETIAASQASGAFEKNRRAQKLTWFAEFFDHLLDLDVMTRNEIKERKNHLMEDVGRSQVSVQSAARDLLSFYHQLIRKETDLSS